MPGYSSVQGAPPDPKPTASIHPKGGHLASTIPQKVPISKTRSDINEVCGDCCKARLLTCPVENCAGNLRTDGTDKSGSCRMKCNVCEKSCGPRRIFDQLLNVRATKLKPILQAADTRELMRIGVDIDEIDRVQSAKGNQPMSPAVRASIRSLKIKDVPEELLEAHIDYVEKMLELDSTEQMTKRREDQRGKQTTPPGMQKHNQNRFAALEEHDMEYEEGETEEDEELSPKQKRALLEIEETSRMMEEAKETLKSLAMRQEKAHKDFGCGERDMPAMVQDSTSGQYITRQEFNRLEKKIDDTMEMLRSLAAGRERAPSTQTQAPRMNSGTQSVGMAAKIAATEDMRRQGLIVLRNERGEAYGVKPEVLEAKARRTRQTQRPTVLHFRGFSELRYSEIKGLMGAYGINVADIIIMSHMGPYTEMLVAGEAVEEITRILAMKGYTREKVDVFEGGPLKLNVDASALSEEEVHGLRRRAAREAREIRWNKLIAKVPRQMTRKRALFARVRDGRLEELQQSMEEGEPRRPERLTRLDQLVMAKLEEAMQRREATASSDSDGENARRRKIAGHNMQVTPTQGVTQSQ